MSTRSSTASTRTLSSTSPATSCRWELVGVYSVKLVRAQIEGNTDAAEKLDRMIRCHMKDLKTTKIAREG